MTSLLARALLGFLLLREVEKRGKMSKIIY